MSEDQPTSQMQRATDTDEILTLEDLRAVKEISKYWAAGKIVVAVLVALGAGAIGLLQLMEHFKGFK